ncbi:hypothetical protein NUW58_g6648 [Xylaria curta]|uniref:Uncharacterized protein n=1 Tax=Xylaria curta TaxID=42375 RepID=A0ACC1NQQ5_9PEZI|nr:hypothetical protein NUW58_g6648 [Xylaria curta]
MASELHSAAPGEPTKEVAHETIERTTSSSSSVEQPSTLISQRTHTSPDARHELAGDAVGTGKYGNGYHFPPKYPIGERIRMGLASYWEFYNTLLGVFITVYALNVVGWGFMLVLLLGGAAPQMCWVNGEYNCDHIDSQRRIWIEIDAQILTALFSATGFGLAGSASFAEACGRPPALVPSRGSDQLPPSLGPKNIEETTVPYDTNVVPYPLNTIPDAPLTGVRAPPSEFWRMDFIAWVNFWYVVFQAFLSGIMWGMSRYDRPPWATGFLFALTFITSSAAGGMEVAQVMRVKAIEGVALTKTDIQRLARDKELGIPHYNNMYDENTEEKEREKAEKKVNKKSLFSR